LEPVPKLFGTDTLIFFYQKTRTEPEQLFYFWMTSTRIDANKFKRFQSLQQSQKIIHNLGVIIYQVNIL